MDGSCPRACRGHVLDVFSPELQPPSRLLCPEGPKNAFFHGRPGVRHPTNPRSASASVCGASASRIRARVRTRTRRRPNKKPQNDQHLGARRQKATEVSTDPTRHANATLAATRQGETLLR